MLMNKNIKEQYDLVVIGGGPAGMAAAIKAKEAGLKDVLVLERQSDLGGILPQCIHNGFGSVLFGDDMPGSMYAAKFIEQIAGIDLDILTDTMVLELTPELQIYASNHLLGYLHVRAKSVVLAMGCRERTRAQIKLPGSRPAGVYSAGTVQRFVNIDGYMPGKEFVILGSGDIGMIMARRLTLEGAHVNAVLELLPFLTGLRRNYVQCLKDFSIPLMLSTTVKKIIGDKRLEAIETVQVDDNLQPVDGTEEYIPCDSLLLSVGLIPENELSMQAGVELDELTGGPIVDERMSTSVPGIFAAGNVVTIYDLVDYVSNAGFTAGESAAAYVKSQQSNSVDKGAFISIRPGVNVRSLIPHKINADFPKDQVSIKFRAGKLFDNKVKVELRDGWGSVVKSYNKRYARPAEMLMVDIKRNDIKEARISDLTVNIVSN